MNHRSDTAYKLIFEVLIVSKGKLKSYATLATFLGAAGASAIISTASAAEAPPFPPNVFKITNGDETYSVTQSLPAITSSSSLPGTQTYFQKFESSSLDMRYQAYFDHSLNIVNVGQYADSPKSAISGSRMLRVVMKPTDLNKVNRYRTEVMTKTSGVLSGKKRNWIEWYMYFPSNFKPGRIGKDLGETDGLILGQIFQSNRTGPSLVLALEESTGGGGAPYTWSVQAGKTQSGKKSWNNISVGTATARKFSQAGQWVKFKIEYKTSQSNNGVARLWMNDELLAEMKGYVGHSETEDLYFKTGIYHRTENTTALYIDNIKVHVQ